MDLKPLQEVLDYTFSNTALLEHALTHPSCAQEQSIESTHTYQRLEFLGDAVLDLILAEELFKRFPKEREGFLARARAALAKKDTLFFLANRLNLGDYIRMSRLEKSLGGQERVSTLEDVFEALIGALFLDSNFEVTKEKVLTWYGDFEGLLHSILEADNPKGRLQEYFQQELRQNVIEYVLLERTGPSHDPEFTVEVRVSDEALGQGTGKSKKEAEEAAAREALIHIQKESS